MTEPNPPKPPQGDAAAVPRLTVPGVAQPGFAADRSEPRVPSPTAATPPPLVAPPAQPQRAPEPPATAAPNAAPPAAPVPSIDPKPLQSDPGGDDAADAKAKPKRRLRRPRILSSRSREPSNAGAEARIAGALTLVWLLSFAAYATLFPEFIGFVTSSLLNTSIAVVAICFPLVLIWSVAYVSSAVRSIRVETLEMRQSLASLRASVQHAGALDLDKEVQQRLNRILVITQETDDKLRKLADQTAAVAAATQASARRQAEAAERAEAQAAVSASQPQAADPPASTSEPSEPELRDTAAFAPPKVEDADEDQAKLPLHTPEGPDRIPISIPEFVRAMNFPENADDKEGFRVLRRAFEERDLGKLLRASQDVLTLLSQDGIYVDDLNPDRPLPQVWRKFAEGERGLSVVALGGIRDRSALTLTKARLKNDPVFRDATHHFLRQFDKVLATFCKTAKDPELIEMSNTRTARAFMLLGRVAGAFD